MSRLTSYRQLTKSAQILRADQGCVSSWEERVE